MFQWRSISFYPCLVLYFHDIIEIAIFPELGSTLK